MEKNEQHLKDLHVGRDLAMTQNVVNLNPTWPLYLLIALGIVSAFVLGMAALVLNHIDRLSEIVALWSGSAGLVCTAAGIGARAVPSRPVVAATFSAATVAVGGYALVPAQFLPHSNVVPQTSGYVIPSSPGVLPTAVVLEKHPFAVSDGGTAGIVTLPRPR